MTGCDVSKMADAHWGYVASVLRTHGETDDVIEKCGHHYKTAFIHGWKHAKEDNAQPKGPEDNDGSLGQVVEKGRSE